MTPLKVALVSGSFPPDACGVGAYVARLAESLRGSGIETAVVSGGNWRASDVPSIRRRLDALEPDLVHLHYPTLGYGAGLAPHVLSIVRRSVVTMHEVRYTHLLRKLSLTAFAVGTTHMVFTTEAERRYLLRFLPWLRSRSSVIPVGSSIPVRASESVRTEGELIHFGLLRPEKGLEQVVELAALLRRHESPLRIRVVGEVVPKWSGYVQKLRASAAGLPIVWETGLPDKRLAEVLARGRIGYLPFPDGASERRTSLLALLEAGVATITTPGAETPDAMMEAVRFAADAKEAYREVQKLESEPAAVQRLAFEGQRYARRFDWDVIASMHQALYSAVLDERSAVAARG
jgi:glycosyltransferase involved in cell wall biosynthesis